MKKKAIIISLLIFCISIFTGCKYIVHSEEDLGLVTLNYDDIKDKLIRFHVIANSDSAEDQGVKLLVRDAVINSLNDKLKDVNSVDEARIILNNSRHEIDETAITVLRENGFSYNAVTTLSNENFPDKVYGDCIFPEGNYEAYRIVLGNGEGHNWWCVMFPSLCFADETKHNIDSTKIQEELKKEIKESTNEESKNPKKIKFKLKIVEKAKELFD